jgi:hypothetical protein
MKSPILCTAVPFALLYLFILCVNVINIVEDLPKNRADQILVTWHSGVYDTAVYATAVSLTPLVLVLCSQVRFPQNRYSREDFEAVFEKALARVLGARGTLFDENPRGLNSRVVVPLKRFQVSVAGRYSTDFQQRSNFLV